MKTPSSDTVFVTLFITIALLTDMQVAYHAFTIPPIPDWVDLAMNTTMYVGATIQDELRPIARVAVYPLVSCVVWFTYMMSYFPFATMTAVACLHVV